MSKYRIRIHIEDTTCVYLLGILHVSTHVSDSLYACIHIPVSRNMVCVRTGYSTCLRVSMSSRIHIPVPRNMVCVRTGCPNCLRVSMSSHIHIPVSQYGVSTNRVSELPQGLCAFMHTYPCVSIYGVCWYLVVYMILQVYMYTYPRVSRHGVCTYCVYYVSRRMVCLRTVCTTCLDAWCVYVLCLLHVSGSLCLHIYICPCVCIYGECTCWVFYISRVLSVCM